MEFKQLGPYEIHRRLGRGGMGTVYAATSRDTGGAAAVKVLSAALAHEEGFRERFEAEIESLKKLRHPQIVRLFGYGEQDGTLFYAMEIVEGTSLEEALQAGRRFDWQETTRLGIQICKALKHAHDHGVIHRDIKPANLLLTQDGDIRLSDFGIAKLFGNTGMTVEGGVLGTAEYMAPEQADGRPVNSRCDLYSLGCVLYALLAGRPPFKARSLPEMLQLQRFAEPDPVRRFCPDVPPEFEQILSQLLEKEPGKRIPSAMVLARRLETMEKAVAAREARHEQRTGDGGGGSTGAVSRGSGASGHGPPPGAQGETIAADAVSRIPNRSDDFTLAPAAPVPGRTSRGDATSAAGEAPWSAAEPSGTAATSASGTNLEPAVGINGASAKPTRFTTVREQDEAAGRRGFDREQWLQAGILLASLAAVAAVLWWFLQPTSPAKLLAQISAAAEDGSPQSLRDVEPQLVEFLARFPDDARAGELRGYLEEVELERMERQLTSRRSRIELLSPIERGFVEAMQYTNLEPERGIAQLQAVLDLAPSEAELEDDRTRRCLELTRRRLEHLRKQQAIYVDLERAWLRERLAAAAEFEAKRADRARSMYDGIVERYRNKAWAVAEVQQAEAALRRLTGRPRPAP